MKKFVIILLISNFALLLVILVLLLRSDPEENEEGNQSQARDASVTARPEPDSEPNMRQKIAEAIKGRTAKLSNLDDVQHYLDELEEQARQKGKVTALEVLPGVKAISNLEGKVPPEKLEKMRHSFSEKMAELSKQLRSQEGAELSKQLRGQEGQEVTKNPQPRFTHPEDLDPFLRSLESKARAEGGISNEIMSEGIEAIRGLEPTLGLKQTEEKVRDFSHRMSVLSKQIRSDQNKAHSGAGEK